MKSILKYLIISLWIIFSITKLSAQIPTIGLQAYYKFNGNVFDELNLNNGTIVGSLNFSEDRNSISGFALSVAGNNNNYVKLNNSIGNFGTGDFTISTYFNTLNSTQGYLYGKRGNDFWGNMFGLSVNFDTLSFEISDLPEGTLTGGKSMRANQLISPSTWYFVTVTRMNGTIRLYLNGTLESELLNANSNINNPFNFTIGITQGSTTPLFGQFKGLMDEFSIYNRAFSDSEAKLLYQHTNLNNGLVAYYPFNGNPNDESGNGYHLTTTGFSNNSSPILTLDRFGNANSAYHFDINTKLFETTIPSFNSISISLWFKASDVSIGAHNPTLITLYDINDFNSLNSSFSIGHYVKPYQPGSPQNVFATINVNQSGLQTNIFSNTNSCIAETWYNIVSTYDDLTNSLKIYQNGVLKNNVTAIADIKTITNLMIGSHHKYSDNTLADYTTTGAATYITGEIDDIRIYNRSITQEEVNMLLIENYVPIYNCNTTPIISIIGKQLATDLVNGVSYLWYFNNASVVGSNSNVLNSTINSGSYKVRLSTDYCTIISDPYNILIPQPNVVTVTSVITVTNIKIVTVTSINTITLYECPTLTGENTFDENARLEIYPNPTNGSFSILTQNDDLSKISILNLNGSTIKEVTSLSNISISDLPKGMYFLKVITSKGMVKTVKIMLE